MKALRIVCMFLFAMNYGNAWAQYVPVTSQYLFNGLVINPAYAGSQNALSVSASHRSQWVGFDGAPSTQNLAVHGPLKSENVALGAMFYRDAIGVTTENGLYATYAYRMKVNTDGFFSLGLGGGVSMYNSRWNEVALNATNDPQFDGPSPLFIKPNVSFGMYFYNKKFFGGLSVPFMLSHKLSLTGNRYKVYNDFKNYNVLLQVGTFINLSKGFVLKPSVLAARGPANSLLLDGTVQTVIQNKYSIGLTYRTTKAMVAIAQMRINDQWFAGYSYDYTFSALRNYQSGSHEVLLRYLFYYRVNARSPRYF
ncbi:MAG TPA: type IX secretion system membrane protein PorP/SprF [Flavobacteriales bacterium]|nr:type IX secretion system membrane protein PorP/SprF [Flavobacteriales bacterium]